MSYLNLEKGINVIKEYSKNIPNKSGIYKMLAFDNEILYIGKAKNLFKRVKSYSNPLKLNFRLQKMVSLVNKIDFIITKDEAYALLLEASLIKEVKPKFNILLKDDKSYPYITLRKSHKWCQIKKHRGKKIKGDKYYGPFASVFHVNNTLDILQKVFPIRTCSDHEIDNKKRPCIQYQIKRCSAPCTNLISKEEYNKIVDNLDNFLLGKESKILKRMVSDMNKYSEKLDFEKAAILRDKIRSLDKINQTSKNTSKSTISADFFCITNIKNVYAIEIIFFRNGKNFGSNTHYPYIYKGEKNKLILNKFIAQFYSNNTSIPGKVFISCDIQEKELLQKALSLQNKKDVKIELPNRQDFMQIIDEGINKAKKNLADKISKSSNIIELHKLIKKKFSLAHTIKKIEVYDNSHYSGKEAVGSFITADINGFNKKEYRKFNIKIASKNDDYGMMKEVLNRRLNKKNNESFPDLIIIDGGLGQLSVAKEVLNNLEIKNISLISISKGKMRNASNEKFYNSLGIQIYIKRNEPLFYYLLRLRDEAHRFAITNHRNKRNSNLFKSEIDNIDNIGPRRKKNLILHFGSLEEIKKAELRQLENVQGINKNIAKIIYNYFRVH